MVQLGDDGKVKWSKLHYPAGDIGNSMHEGMFSRTHLNLVSSLNSHKRITQPP